ncbi:MAG: hemolysin III family protein [Candidatus Paceibacterota bacterium]|jgi:hemolysin III
MNIKIKDPLSGYSHLAGAVIFFIGTIMLIKEAKGLTEIFSFLAFGATAFLLYLASAWYHLFGGPAEKIDYARKLDHALIYFLIAGTFTPFCLVLMRGLWGWVLFGSVWTLAAIGTAAIFFESFWKFFPRWASTGLYLLMGWLGATVVYPLRTQPEVIGLLAAGGAFYTVGAVIYILKKPNFGKVNFHDIFHFFILAGTLAHFWCIYRYIALAG